jgi:hypothetical protein
VYGSTTVDQVDTQLHQHVHEQDYSLETFSTKYRRRADQTARPTSDANGFLQHGTGVGLSMQYVLAQMSVTEPAAA